jgi:hypothetical protein
MLTTSFLDLKFKARIGSVFFFLSILSLVSVTRREGSPVDLRAVCFVRAISTTTTKTRSRD